MTNDCPILVITCSPVWSESAPEKEFFGTGTRLASSRSPYASTAGILIVLVCHTFMSTTPLSNHAIICQAQTTNGNPAL